AKTPIQKPHLILYWPKVRVPCVQDTRRAKNITHHLKPSDNKIGVLNEGIRTISKRLLHPGADTSDIITFYISMIRCLRVVDPQGVILYRVADPIRSYLRGRPDTIHHIVTLLINENSELAQEDQAPIVPEMEHEDYSDPKWIPEPRDAGPSKQASTSWNYLKPLLQSLERCGLQTLSVLWSAYMTRTTYSSRSFKTCLQTYCYKREKETSMLRHKRQIEILKLRFGDAALQAPDVMLSDMQASSRLSRQVDETSEAVIKAAVVSRWFWPDPPELDKFKMPGQFARLQEEFGKKYEQIKPDKRLHWVHQMGTLKLAIELKDRTVEVTATPLEAAVIELFSENEALGVKEQTDSSRCAEANHGKVVMQQTDVIKQSTEDAFDSRDQQDWLHIKRALTNFGGGLSTSRIHSLLKYSPNPKTMPQLEALLERLQAEHLIEGIEGVWRLENRLQTIQCQQQIKEMQLLIADLMKRVEESEARTFRQLSALASEIGKRTDDIGHIRQQLRSSSADWWCTSAASTPASRTINIETPSPTTTVFSDPSLEQSDIDDKWDVPNWLSEEGPRHPFKSHTSFYIGQSNEMGEKTKGSTGEEMTPSMLHELPEKHDLDEIVHSPYGPANLEAFLTAEQNEKLMIRRIDDDDHTMRFISDDCDRYPIVLGGLNEPIIEGRFRDEKDVHQASIFRSRRWGTHTNLLLRRLPSRENLLPDDSLLLPAHILQQRRKTCWEDILGAPPEDTRAAFADALQQYMGYTGTKPSGPPSDQNAKGRRLDSLIPYLLDAFDNAVKNPWHHRGTLSDLIVDLDDFAVQRELEAIDSAYLWRGVLTNTFPKLCLKHIKMGSVGGSDPRWPVVQVEYSERLVRRRQLWSAIAQYRFPQDSYLPNGKVGTPLDRGIQLKQLVHESIYFAHIMKSWKDGVVGVKNRILPQLETFGQRNKPLEESELEGWMQLVSSLHAFYASKVIHSSPSKASHQMEGS
ncbi:6618_t:CDS:10, partial [Acaulospora colombiana]